MKSLDTYPKREINEASSITFDELPLDKQIEARVVLKIFGAKETADVFEGIGGFVIMLEPKVYNSPYKFMKDKLVKLVKVKSFRWVSDSTPYIAVGI
jgi:hypothetical protein